MEALVCEICGGKLVMGSGGIAVCDSCGLEYSKERIKERIQEIKGVVQIDNSHMIDNWMKMGTAAAAAGNHKEAYDYFTKVIEIDPKNWRAVYEKGKAGAWQSTLGNLRTSEIYQGIRMALDILEQSDIAKDELVSIKNEFAVALFNFNNAITDLMEENLNNIEEKYFDSHYDTMVNMKQRYLTNIEQLEDALTLISDYDDDLSKSNTIEFKKRMCSDLRKICSSIQYWLDYSKTKLDYLGFKPEAKKKYLDKFWSLVDEIRDVESGFKIREWEYPDPFAPGFHYSDEFYKYWQKFDEERRSQKEREKKEQRINEYWSHHEQELKALGDRLSDIQKKKESVLQVLADYDERIKKAKKETEEKVTEVEKELIALKSEIGSLEEQRNSLGFFSGKQKKELQAKIDMLKEQFSIVEDRAKSSKAEIEAELKATLDQLVAECKPYTDKLNQLNEEELQINTELKKDR